MTPAVWLWCGRTGQPAVLPVLCAACCTLLILWAHRGNIARLAHGQENKL